MHILLPNYTNFFKKGQFEKSVFVIMSTRESIRLMARNLKFEIVMICSGSILFSKEGMNFEQVTQTVYLYSIWYSLLPGPRLYIFFHAQLNRA